MSQGVKVMRLKNDNKIVGVALLKKEEEQDYELSDEDAENGLTKTDENDILENQENTVSSEEENFTTEDDVNE